MVSGERKKKPAAGILPRAACAVLIFTGIASAARAQYSVREWANFESGTLPQGAITIGGDPGRTLQIVPTAQVTTEPAAFRSPEVGKNVLKLTASPDPKDATTLQTGVVIGDVLDRSTLGQKGRALFQADFFVEPSGIFPSLAVLAMEPTSAGETNLPTLHKAFYRFGLTLGNRLYFSCVDPKKPKAPIFLQDSGLLKKIPRPGWHRFAIVCEGPDVLRCYVDGREAAFSPIRDSSIGKIKVGLMLADQKEAYAAYADNISIQVSSEAPALPASPYESGWNTAAGPSKKARSSGVNLAAPMSGATNLASNWLKPLDAWDHARSTHQPMLLYFYAPGVERTQKMNDIFNNDPAAKAYLASHSCARVDVNQLEGGSIARKYNIFKVPALLVISSDASQAKQVTPGPSDDWKTISGQLSPL